MDSAEQTTPNKEFQLETHAAHDEPPDPWFQITRGELEVLARDRYKQVTD